MRKYAIAAVAALSLVCGTFAVTAQPVQLTPESVRVLPNKDGALGILYRDEIVYLGNTQAVSLTVNETLAPNINLRTGDMVVAVNDRSANAANILASYIASHSPGTTVKLTVVRGDTKREEIIEAAILNRGNLRIPGIDPPASNGTTFARSCVAGAVGGVITAGFTLMLAPFDGGFTFAAFAPKAVAGAIIGCAAVGSGAVVAQEAVPPQNLTAYRRIM